jgi:hypothetical protein
MSEGLPHGPSKDERGLFMRVDGAEFRTRDQLAKPDLERLQKKGLKPIEVATFTDVRACSRDHLRTYCVTYNMKKKEKIEMELDMARYVAAWHWGEPGYELNDYKPSVAPGSARPSFSTPISSARLASRPLPSPGQVLPTPADSTSGAGSEIDPSLLKTAAARPETRTIKRARLSVGDTPPRLIKSAKSLATPWESSGKASPDSAVPAEKAGLSSKAPSAAKAAPATKSAPPAKSTSTIKSTPSAKASPSANDVPYVKASSSAKAPPGARSQRAANDPTAVTVLPTPSISHAPAAPVLTTAAAPISRPTLAGYTPAPRAPPARKLKNMVEVPAPAVIPVSAPAPSPAALSAAAATSFKQSAHARQASARFKAAYNGAGAPIVQVVENAAAYFEGRDTSETVLDKKRSYERYQFNVDMLSEIFDGPPLPAPDAEDDEEEEEEEDEDEDEEYFEEEGGVDNVLAPNGAMPQQASRIPHEAGGASFARKDDDGDVLMDGVTATKPCSAIPVGDDVDEAFRRRKSLTDGVMDRLASAMVRRTDDDRALELKKVEQMYAERSSREEAADKLSYRAFQRLDRARTAADIERAKLDFEAEHNIKFVSAPKAVVRRKLDSSAPLFIPPSDVRIIRFD